MSSFGDILLSAVFRMLDECAPGYVPREALHHWHIVWNGRSHRSLPLGSRKSKTPSVKAGKVRSMVRVLGIPVNCVNGHFPGLISDET